MAESNSGRPSGRTAASTSGRVPPQTNVSGRAQPQPASNVSGRAQPQPVINNVSGRAPQQPASVSGRAQPQAAASPSGRMTPQPGSGRQAAQPQVQQVQAAPPQRTNSASSRTTRRDDAASGQSGKKYKPKRGYGKELMYIFGFVAVLGVVALLLYVQKKGQQRERDAEIEKRQSIYEANMKLGYDMYEKAKLAGFKYVTGQEDPDIMADDAKLRQKLFSAFEKDDKIYNVVFDRRYKDKKTKEKIDNKYLYPDKTRIETIQAHSKKERDVALSYGMADGRAQDVVIASENLQAKKDDPVNLGGSITVIVKATRDPIFEAARKPQEEKK